MDVTEDQRAALLGKFLTTIPIREEPERGLFVIAMVGLPGSGKSTVAREISRRLNVYIASNDKIRRFLNDEGYPGVSPIQEVLQFIAESQTDYLLDHHVSHIIDNDLIKFVDAVRSKIARYRGRMYLINVVCPEDVNLKRLDDRLQKVSGGLEGGHSRAGEEEYRRRKEVHMTVQKPTFDFVVYSDQDLASQIDDITRQLVADGVA
jgi:cytidylate kinase